MAGPHKHISLFHIGPPKAATTWAYYNLKAHPQIATSPRDTVHYYDMHFHKGRDWYDDHFLLAKEGQLLFDPTPSYILSDTAPRRIYQDAPDARFLICLRNPVDRAFSHYWHFKKKQVIDFQFSDLLKVYDFYDSWLGYGLLADKLERWLAFFPRDRFHIIPFEQIALDPQQTYADICAFCGIDADFAPQGLTNKINAAGPRHSFTGRMIKKVSRHLKLDHHPLAGRMMGKGEYMEGITPALRAELNKICLPDITRMEELLQHDLSHWKQA